MKLFLGTTNPGKVREIVSILSATGCAYELTDPVDPDEIEPDFAGNALLKARAYAACAGGPTISEDSGLIVPSLGGLPGAYSARFSECEIDTEGWRISQHIPSGASREVLDQRNNELLLELLQGVEQPRRAAAFVVVLAVCQPDGQVLFSAKGESHGWIAEQARGSGGFGYDPVFVGQDTHGKTYAELDSMRKNLRSHRRKVLQEFKAWLGRFLKQGEDR